MAKPKKPRKPKKLNHDQAFDIGWNAEQTLADDICGQIQENDEEALDTAFVAAFRSLTLRMLDIWKPEYLLALVNDAAKIDEEHSCEECKKESDSVLVVPDGAKNNVH